MCIEITSALFSHLDNASYTLVLNDSKTGFIATGVVMQGNALTFHDNILAQIIKLIL